MSPYKQTLLALCFTLSASAQTYRIHDGGMQRTFVIEEIPAATAALKDAPAEEPQIILYEAGAKKTKYSKRVVTRQVLVELKPGTDPSALAEKYNVVLLDSPTYAPGFHILKTATYFSALQLAETLRDDPSVLSAEPLLARQHQKKNIPNDPLFTNQWHLLNTGQNGGTAGIDINVTNVWETYQGSNVVIGIVDDGLDLDHEDLIANLNTNIDWDFNYNDAVPQAGPENNHGTSCAGVAAGRGNNSVGISGAAPQATLVGMRLIAKEATDSEEATAFAHSNSLIHIKSNSWGPDDSGMTTEGPGTLAAAALKTAVETGREGKGTLFFWAGGNGYDNDNVNYDGYANSIYTLAIGAVDSDGIRADYSESGACLIVCAPSSGDSSGITTASNGGGYEGSFGGTSSATPLAAGVGALMLEANPNLGWRDVQEILMASARKNDASDAEWATNAAGFHFNHKYGAGMVDADLAVNLSETWTNLDAHTNTVQNHTNLNLAIPDHGDGIITNTFSVPENFRVEHAVLTVNITHSWRGDVGIFLVSPAGTESELSFYRYDYGEAYDNWSFTTVRNWGENSAGEWKVRVYDIAPDDTGTVHDLTLTLYGSDTNPALLLPFSEPFDDRTLGDLNGQNGWTGAGTVQAGTVYEGTQALALTNGTAAHTFDGEATNIWVTLWAQPTLSDDPPEDIPTNAAAVFYVNASTNLVAYDSTNATVISSATFSNGWNKIAVSCDYISKVWNLELNSELVVSNFAFYGSPASFQALEIVEGSASNTLFVDSITVSDTSDGSDPSDTDADGLPDSWETNWFGNLEINPSDPASNGVDTVWATYIAGLDPTSPTNRFLVSVLGSPSSVLRWNSVSGRIYSVYWTSNLLSNFQPLETNLPWTEMPYTDTNNPATGQGFYKIDVELE